MIASAPLPIPVSSRLLNGEPLLTLTQACKLLPGSRGADRRNPATLTRHILRGCRGINGKIVKLEAVRDSFRWLTSEAALVRFSNALSEAADDAEIDATPSPSSNLRDAEAAGRKLIAMGA